MITKKCRDCGREFTLTDGEIDFYRSKGFELPSRCKACRDKRKGRQTPSSASNPTRRHTPPPKKPNLPAYLLVLILAVGLVFTVVTKLTDTFITSELPQTSAVTENITSALTTAEISADTSVSQQETEVTTSSETSAEYTTTTAETTATAPQTTAAAAVSAPSPHFRNEERLNEHYEKHGIEMGFATPAEYEAAAAAVVNSPDALHKLEKEDGDDVYYIESTNEFVIVSTDGYIRTYYHPTNGKEYFDNQ